jgi:hypothetical protein
MTIVLAEALSRSISMNYRPDKAWRGVFGALRAGRAYPAGPLPLKMCPANPQQPGFRSCRKEVARQPAMPEATGPEELRS